MLRMMSNLRSLTQPKRGFVGFAAAASLAIGFCAILSLAVPIAGLVLFFFWTLPSLIHARASIVRQSLFVPLPWEDQFAAVIVGFILQIPLWLTAGFIGFLLAAVLLAGTPTPTIGGWPLESAVYFVLWIGVTIGIYCLLFFATLIWSIHGIYHDDPASKCVSIRDAKPIYHPF